MATTDPRLSARAVTQFISEQKRMADSDADIDYDALSRLDELSDEDAAALIDQQMALILSD